MANGIDGATFTMQAGAAVTGAGFLMNVGQLGSVVAQVSGSFVGTVTFESTTDGANWNAVPSVSLSTGVVSTTTTVPGSFQCPVAGAQLFRARISAYTSGAITVIGIGTAAGPGVVITGENPAGKMKIRDLAAVVTAVKTSPGVLKGLRIENNQGAAAWIQVFDLATGSVTLATTNPDLEYKVAANSSLDAIIPTDGVSFSIAISIASTTAEKGNSGSAAGVQVFALFV